MASIHKRIIFVIACTCVMSSLIHANENLTLALMEAIMKKNFALSVALYSEISKDETDKAEVVSLIKSKFQKIFGHAIDDATQAVIQFNQQLADADKDEKKLRELFIDLMTNPQQPGGKIADKLGIDKATLISAIS